MGAKGTCSKVLAGIRGAETLKIVVPGEPICVIEEFLPGKGTLVERDGVIKAKYVGKVVYNFNDRTVSVNAEKVVDLLEKDDRVVAEIVDVQRKIAVAEAFAKLPDEPLKYRRTGVLVVRRTDQIENLVGVGDIAILQVVSVFRGIVTFDIYRPGLGVLIAMCSVCGRLLEKKDHTLVCSRCGNRERRKTVLKYGNLQLLKELVSTNW